MSSGPDHLLNAPGIIAIVSYLLGSIPFGYLLVRVFKGVDVRATGSGNIGATNVARTGSKGLAIATLLLDALKGYVAVEVAFRIGGGYVPYWLGPPIGTAAEMPTVVEAMRLAYRGAAFAALFAILGHMFTPWLRFKGGKGVATALGAFAALAPGAVLVSLVVFILVVLATRYVSLGSILAAAVFPVAVWYLNPLMRTPGIMLLVTFSAILVILRHKDNIRRLLEGTENKFR